ncbi:MAG: bifunctional N-acetylglucosamine-1-phosphate uridyltransferase/glucosamine-1-phosphate acetyltransferase [Planctomycetes bacterium]|nr:bifunctional N-acetylglucosamine-1-phosphate uridyltransferase/glucosamine-1-phosphate acetyltransferase [Planctomycetota bacterium]
MSRPLAVIVLAAGLGKRTKVRFPKVLLPLCGRTLLDTVLDAVAELEPVRTVVVLHHQRELVEKSLAARIGLTVVDQGEPRGTGHAVQVAMAELADFDGDVLVCYGDMPLLTAGTLYDLCEARGDAAVSILTACPPDPSGLGRILRDEDGGFCAIREERDCSDFELDIEEINVGIYCYDAARLRPALEQLSDDNAQGELYLTDTPALLLAAGERVETLELEDVDEALGVNSLLQLAIARSVMQERILEEHMLAGVVVEDPTTTVIEYGVTIGANARILPFTVIRRGVVVGPDCEVGPFSHLRAGTRLEPHAEVGNFVEVKQTTIGAGTKAKHLTYLGDTEIGAHANIGAGTITANYDGKAKHRTVIGDRAFIGSGTVLVAPATVGDGAMTGAGAIVRRHTAIGPGEVWVGVPARRLRSADDGGREERT